MRRWVGLAALTAILVGPAPITARPAGAANDPLDEARRAAQQTPFSGLVSLRWHDGSTFRSDVFTVKGVNGTVVAQGDGSAMAVGTERLVYVPGDGWHELWPSGMDSPGRPALSDSYELRPAGTGMVAGYTTDAIYVVKSGAVRERLDLEATTKLLLRREQYGPHGHLERAFTFVQVHIGAEPTTPPTMPPAPKKDAPKVVGVRSLPLAEREPAQLAAGYRRLGVYAHGDVVQMVYSDGLYDLSLFQQDGGLDPDDLPAARQTVRLAGHAAWTYSWPGGEGITWTAGHTVYTLMGDVPPDELRTVAGSVSVHRSTSVAHRLRQACRVLVESFRGGR